MLHSSDNDDVNNTNKMSKIGLHKNSLSMMDNSLSTSINTYNKTNCLMNLGYENYGLAANRLMTQFKNQPYNGLSTIASGGENENPNRSDNHSSVADLNRNRSETFVGTKSTNEQHLEDLNH